jgi:hypothetical protein
MQNTQEILNIITLFIREEYNHEFFKNADDLEIVDEESFVGNKITFNISGIVDNCDVCGDDFDEDSDEDEDEYIQTEESNQQDLYDDLQNSIFNHLEEKGIKTDNISINI